MKVLTASSQTQGWRDNDFCWTVEGELVLFPPIECGRGSVDDACGCRRSMSGLTSHMATTTMKVADREELGRDSYFVLVSDCLRDQGYVNEKLMAKRDVKEWLYYLTDELIYLAGRVPTGTVLERRGDLISVRHFVAGP